MKAYRILDNRTGEWWKSSNGHTIWLNYPHFIKSHEDKARLCVVEHELNIEPSANDLFYQQIEFTIEHTGWKVERTGNILSIGSSEFVVTRPDGMVMNIWSAPWSEIDGKHEEYAAIVAAAMYTDFEWRRPDE